MSFDNTLNIERLQKGIALDIHACEQLLELLSREHLALTQRNTEQLEKIINDKSVILSQLNQSAITRSQWVNHFKQASQSQPQAITDTFTAVAQKAGLAKQWETLQALFKQCKMANEINGKTMTRSQATNERLLSILRGQHNNPHLYDGKGAKGQRGLGNTLGQA